MGPTESMIAIGVTLMLVAGLIMGGVYAFRTLTRSSQAQSGAVSDGGAKGQGDKPPLVTHSGPTTLPRLSDLPENAESAKAKLVGNWVSRADDGSVAIVNFRADGTASFSDSATIESGEEPLDGKWALIGLDGDLATVAIYYSASGLHMHRMTIELATPDCINIIESAFRGGLHKWDQRFVRETAPPSGK